MQLSDKTVCSFTVESNNGHHQEKPDEQTATVTVEETDLAAPKMYHVILLNDDYTPMDFVIELLMVVFHKPYEQAQAIMLTVHHKNRGIAGTYTHEIAVEKMNKANEIAIANGFPLQTIIEVA